MWLEEVVQIEGRSYKSIVIDNVRCYSIPDAALQIGIPDRTFSRWVHNGKVYYYTDNNNHRRYVPENEIARMKEELRPKNRFVIN